MKDQTILQLSNLNQRFYDDQASSWSKSREYVWPSWETFFNNSSWLQSDEIALLDVGCGTGRFATFARQHWQKVTYEGIDNSTKLLGQAQHASDDLNFSKVHQVDLVQSLLMNQPWSENQYPLIVAFGVLHHIPSQKLRKRFLQEIFSCLEAGGEFWLTLWLPKELGYKAPATRDWREVATSKNIDPEDHEPGDVFLGWKNSTQSRYVHWMQPEEREELFLESGLQTVTQWDEMRPGERGNRCYLLRR